MVQVRRGGGRKEEFLRKGLNVLADDGPRALGAARLARELQVTTGSFYWHFESVSEFHDALRRYWKDSVLVGLAREARAEADDDPSEFFARLGQLIQARKTYRYDAAMRKWAKTDLETARIIEAADEWRRGLISDVFRATGVEKEDAQSYTDLLGAAWRGSEDMSPPYRFKLMSLAQPKG